MRVLRPLLWAVVLVTAFLYITSTGHWNVSRLLGPLHPGSVAWTEPASAAPAYTTDEQNNIDIYKTASEATVNITSVVYQQDFFFQVYPVEGAGSGFIINADGEILTNNHVVRGSRQLTVTLHDKKVYKAKVMDLDQRSDLALLKIDAGRKLPTLPLGNSDGLVVGQKVLAIGNPFGFGGTLTTGVVSSLDRSIQTEENRRLESMIQTDAAINPGNSGGPLLDSRGTVIGINTAIYGAQGNIGIGFATPINRAKAMLQEIQQRGHVSRPAPLGIRTRYVSGDLAEMLKLPTEGGLLIESVERGSAADTAGLLGARQTAIVGGLYQIGVGGDLIVAADEEKITGNETLPRVMNRKRGGDTLTLTIYRNGRTLKVPVHLGEAPQML
jgi:S1-C subfamily serine protease